mmetsp:Transcript_7740/g.22029  ORF Transcript_7740/g.22029 Transcript_7740/m.22029 type:complete len:191 (+) Transcript_7740:3-575(+)
MPDFPFPLHWLRSLRDLSACEGLAVGRLLDAAESMSNADVCEAVRASWGLVAWTAASAPQLERAVAILRRCGREGALQAADLAGRERETRRFDMEQRLVDALEALPLVRLPDHRVLLAPELPVHSIIAFMLGRQQEMQDTIERLTAQLREARRRGDATDDKVSKLERELKRLQAEVQAVRVQRTSNTSSG